ncbi:RNA polymerase sigma factor [Agromyces sp. SYSU T00194]|uniref:RNA polymerase sigma factor n=1 Tax=Agromyces chitinivorans TaxID=3158560 RepID=UPI003395BE99
MSEATASGPDGVGDAAATRRAIEGVWRIESAKVVAALVRMVHDVGFAEDLAQDAIVAALAQWPESGIPANPAAWLTTTAKRRAVDTYRRHARRDRALQQLAHELAEETAADPAAGVDHVEDDMLRLMFICCHPSLTPEAQATLTLRLVAGLSAREIARAYLTSEPTVAQRISRAKRTLARSGAALEEVPADERSARLATVLGIVYLMFNEGYTATEGTDWMRPALCEEATRLARILTALAPDDPEAHALSALLELQSSRLAARLDAAGRPVLLDDQDRSRWDGGRIRHGLDALARADRLVAIQGGARGPYHLQAAIAACHSRATPSSTDWARIVELYAELARRTGSPVVELNRAVAVGRAYGPDAGLALVEQLAEHPALAAYHLLPSVQGDLLERSGRTADAAIAYLRAANLATNAREAELLRARAARAVEP